MKLVGIIPARYQSSRFPGKPLARILGKPMIWHVYNSARKYPNWHKLVIATDDNRIAKACEEMNLPCIMTNNSHKDCIDRASEVAEKFESGGDSVDRYIIIQGDEPFFNASVLDVDLTPEVVNFYTKIIVESEIYDPNVVKVAISKNLRAVYFSRYSIPYHDEKTKKSNDNFVIDKQLGIYSFSSAAIKTFSKIGMSYLEGMEGIGLLRLIENDIDVYMRYSQFDSYSIDTKEDIDKIEKLFISGQI